MKVKDFHIKRPLQCCHLLNYLFVISFLFSLSFGYTTSGTTTYDGSNQDRGISYYSVTGNNGIRAQLESRSGQTRINFFTRMWIRPDYAMTTLTNSIQTFLEIPKSMRCFINYTSDLIACQQISSDGLSYGNPISINASTIVSNVWLHIAIGGSSSSNINYLRVDYDDQIFAYTTTSSYSIVMQQNTSPWYAYLGVNSSVSGGFSGDIREFLFVQTYITWSQVANIKNQVIYYNTNQIANYRFQMGSLADAFRSTISATLVSSVSTYPSWQFDTLSNDMCQVFMNYTILPKIDYTKTTLKAAANIDARLQTLQNFQYSGSFWMKTMPGTLTTTSAQQARDTYSFFILNGVFALWFYDSTNLKMFIYAEKSYYETQTKSIYFPQGVWANFQFTIDRTNGYEMRLYDMQRRLVTTVSESVYLQDQKPTGAFTIVRNFVGYIKQIMVYGSKKTLPIDDSNGNQDIIKENLLIVYYKFDQQYYTSSSSSFPSLGYNNNGGGPNVVISGTVSWDIVDWDQTYYFSSPTQIGTLSQSFTLWDGIACQQTPLLYKTTTNSSFINYTVSSLGGSAWSSGTVEMWIKRTTSMASTMNFLFSMYSSTLAKEYFAIYQGTDNYLYCKPFDSMGTSTSSSINVQYSNYVYNNLYWQHIVCKFNSGYEVAGVLYTNSDTYNYMYSTSLLNNIVSIPNSDYNIMIGNRYNTSYGTQYTFFKDVRLWSSSRSYLDIIKNRFVQIDPIVETSVFAYFKMNSDEYYVVDYAALVDTINSTTTSYIAKRSGISDEKDSSDAINICPQYTYAMNNTLCYKNPFITQNILLLSEPLTSTTAQWRFTSAFSEYVSSFSQFYEKHLTYKWTTSNMSISNNSNFISYQGMPDMYLNSTIIGNANDTFVLNQTINNTGNTAFLQDAVNFQVKNCRWVADSVSKTSVREYYTYLPQGYQDITFTINYYNYCPPTTETLSQTLDWTAYPSYIDTSGYSYQYTSNAWTFTVPVRAQWNLPTHQPIFYVASAYWNTTTSYNTSLYFQNMVYKIKFIELLKPVITVKNAQTLIGENLILDGSSSYSMNITDSTQAKNDINYYWDCPRIFVSACNRQRNMRFLNITYDDFLIAGASYSTNYNFTLSVWKGQDPDSLANFTTFTLAQWLKVARPNFVLQFYNVGQKKVITSLANTFQVDFKNYDIYSPDLTVVWSLSPAVSSSMSYSMNNTLLTVGASGFSKSTSYNLTVTVTHVTYAFATKTVSWILITGTGPSDGTVTVSPTSGVALSTTFSFSLNGWVTDSYPIKYWITGSSSSQSVIPITQRYYYTNETFITNLTQLNNVTITIVDNAGETYLYYQTLSVSANTQISISDLVSQTVLTQQQIMDNLIQASYQLNSLNTSTVNTNKAAALNYITLLTTSYSSSDNITEDKLNTISKSMTILTQLSNGTTSDSNQALVMSALTNLQNSSANFAQLMLTPSFSSNYASVISNLMSYYQSSASSSTSKRMLQSSSVTNYQAAIKMKDTLANYICQTTNSTWYELQQSTDTGTFTLIVEKIPINSRVFQRNFNYPIDLSYLSLPYNEIIAAEKAINSSIATTCIQVTFYKVNPFTGYSFTSQSIQSNTTMQVNLLNSNNTNILATNGISLSSSSFIQSFKYYYNSTSTTFVNNQTIVEYINSTLPSYTGQSLSYTNTSYTYQVSSNILYNQMNYIGPYYLSVVTDTTRVAIVDKTDTTRTIIELVLAFDGAVVPVLLFLIQMLIIWPLFAFLKDRKDLAKLESDDYDNLDDALPLIAMTKQQPYDQVVYNKKLYEEFIQIDDPSCCNLFRMFFRNIHPLFGFFIRFDFEYKRFARFTVLALQYSLVAWLVTIIFGKPYRVDEQTQIYRDDYDETDSGNAVLTGFILSLLTLPLPYSWVECLKGRVVIDDGKGEDEGDNEEKEDEEDDDDEDGKKSKKKNNKEKQKSKKESQEEYDEDEVEEEEEDDQEHEGGEDEDDEEGDEEEGEEGGDEEGVEDGEEQEHPVTQERMKPKDIQRMIKIHHSFNIDQPAIQNENTFVCRIILLILALILTLGSIIFVAATSAVVPKANSRAITISFFTTILVGWFITNFIRIVINACLAPKYTKIGLEDDEDIAKEGCCQKLLVSVDAILLVEDMLIVEEVMKQVPQNGNKEKKKKKVEDEEAAKDHQSNENLASDDQHQESEQEDKRRGSTANHRADASGNQSKLSQQRKSKGPHDEEELRADDISLELEDDQGVDPRKGIEKNRIKNPLGGSRHHDDDEEQEEDHDGHHDDEEDQSHRYSEQSHEPEIQRRGGPGAMRRSKGRYND